jgi:hypothetical protein
MRRRKPSRPRFRQRLPGHTLALQASRSVARIGSFGRKTSRLQGISGPIRKALLRRTLSVAATVSSRNDVNKRLFFTTRNRGSFTQDDFPCFCPRSPWVRQTGCAKARDWVSVLSLWSSRVRRFAGNRAPCAWCAPCSSQGGDENAINQPMAEIPQSERDPLLTLRS